MVSRGCKDAVAAPLADILSQAVQLRSSALIIAHNHPSGDLRFSAADIDATRRLAELARALGMRLDDHLLFAGGRYRSMRALGLL